MKIRLSDRALRISLLCGIAILVVFFQLNRTNLRELAFSGQNGDDICRIELHQLRDHRRLTIEEDADFYEELLQIFERITLRRQLIPEHSYRPTEQADYRFLFTSQEGWLTTVWIADRGHLRLERQRVLDKRPVTRHYRILAEEPLADIYRLLEQYNYL